MSGTTSAEEFALPDGSYTMSNIQDYFEYTIKEKHETQVNNPRVQDMSTKFTIELHSRLNLGNI